MIDCPFYIRSSVSPVNSTTFLNRQLHFSTRFQFEKQQQLFIAQHVSLSSTKYKTHFTLTPVPNISRSICPTSGHPRSASQPHSITSPPYSTLTKSPHQSLTIHSQNKNVHLGANRLHLRRLRPASVQAVPQSTQFIHARSSLLRAFDAENGV